MNLSVDPGVYVVAVSGGVDSVVLLDLLRRSPQLQLVIAHFDHGMRDDSKHDAQFVAQLSKVHGLIFETERAELGSDAGEAVARAARYDFLESVRCRYDARAIITAHHQDDAIETAAINIIRGTGRRGLTALQSSDHLLRPLLPYSKAELIDYAVQQHLSWQEDSTNYEDNYLRNKLRHRLLVNLEAGTRQQLLGIMERARQLNRQLDDECAAALAQHSDQYGLDRYWFTSLPHVVSREIMASWLRQHTIADFDAATLERLTIGAKTKPSGKRLDVLHGTQLYISKHKLALRTPER